MTAREIRRGSNLVYSFSMKTSSELADSIAALVRRCPAGGHAVLIDVATWGGLPVSPVADAVAALERAGWITVAAGREAAPEGVWDAVVAGRVVT